MSAIISNASITPNTCALAIMYTHYIHEMESIK